VRVVNIFRALVKDLFTFHNVVAQLHAIRVSKLGLEMGSLFRGFPDSGISSGYVTFHERKLIFSSRFPLELNVWITICFAAMILNCAILIMRNRIHFATFLGLREEVFHHQEAKIYLQLQNCKISPLFVKFLFVWDTELLS